MVLMLIDVGKKMKMRRGKKQREEKLAMQCSGNATSTKPR